MATLPLDIDDVRGELAEAEGPQPLAPAGTRVGHVHLQVSDLAEAFYAGVLGFDVMLPEYPGALFVSAGGYHHHIGLNTWHSAVVVAAAPPVGSIGLLNFEVELPSAEELEHVLERIRSTGIEIESSSSDALIRDPSGNRVLLRAGPASPSTSSQG